LKIAVRLGINIHISAEPISMGPMWGQYAAAILAAAFFTAGGYASWRMIGLASAGAALAWFGFRATLTMLTGDIFADFAGALLAAFVMTMLVRRTTIPTFAIINGSILALVPGMRLFRGLLQIVGSNVEVPAPSEGAATLLVAVGVALAIASGASLGMYLGRPIGDRLMGVPLEWYENLRSRRAKQSQPKPTQGDSPSPHHTTKIPPASGHQLTPTTRTPPTPQQAPTTQKAPTPPSAPATRTAPTPPINHV